MPEPVEAELITTTLPPPMASTDTAIVIHAVESVASVRRSQIGKRESSHVVVTFPRGGRQVDIELSAREHQFLAVYIDTFNLYAAAAEMGMDRRTARKFVRSERVCGYIAYRVRQKAQAQGLTLDKVMAKLNGAIDGTDPLDESQLTALGHAGRLLKPATASLVFNQQNNFGAAGAAPPASPYAKMGKDELLNEMREVVAEADGRGAPS